MKNEIKNIEEMINSSDKECRYLAISMLKHQSSNIFTKSKSRELIKKVPVIERINNFSDICYELETSEESILPYLNPQNNQEKFFNACIKISKISQVYNEDLNFPDFSDNKTKYFPYFYYKNGGWSFHGVAAWGDGGSDLPFGFYFNTKEKVEDVVKKFIDIYIDYLNFK